MDKKTEKLLEALAEIERLKTIADHNATCGMATEEQIKIDREKVAQLMLDVGFATGHGDSIDDLLSELKWQIIELLDKV